jgi:hypothetical protein
MEWLSANWLWVVLGLGVAWVLFKGGMGCGMGGHGSHGSHDADAAKRKDPSLNGHATEDAPREKQEAEVARPRRRHRGC